MVSHKLVAHSVIEIGRREAEWIILCFQYLANPRLRVSSYSETTKPFVNW